MAAEKLNPQTVAINAALTAQNIIIANPSATKFMYIWAIFIQTGGTTNLTFYNGLVATGGPLSGPIPMVVQSQINIPDCGAPIFTIDPGASFTMNSSGTTIQSSGWCKYSN